MSFRSKHTSLTNLSSGNERLQPFDGMYLPKSEQDYISRPKNNVKSYFTRSIGFIFILGVVCTLSYVITSFNYLQRIENETRKLVNDAKSLSNENKLRMDHWRPSQGKVEVDSETYSLKNEIGKIKLLLGAHETKFSNEKQKVSNLENNLKIIAQRQDDLKKLLDNIQHNKEKHSQTTGPKRITSNKNRFSTTPPYQAIYSNTKVFTPNIHHDSSNLTNRLESLGNRMDEFDLELEKLEKNVAPRLISNESSNIDDEFEIHPFTSSPDLSGNLDSKVIEMNDKIEKIQHSFTIPRSCHVYQQNGATKSGTYVIDPDGPGLSNPFNAFCDFNTGYTVISHDILNPVSIPPCEGNECFSKYSKYQANTSHLAALTRISESCFQEIIFDCFSAPLVKFAAWVDKSGNHHTIERCSCFDEGNCHTSATKNNCNCDSMPSVHSILQDKIRINNQSLLPITGFKYGFLRGRANFTIGKLFCRGMIVPFNIYELEKRIEQLEKIEEDRNQKLWKLAGNINPCDGGNFGYGGPWSKGKDVGTFENALNKDYLNNTVWREPFGYITIARHNNASCVMSKTWKLKDNHRSLYSYFSSYPGRIHVTGDGTANDNHIAIDLPENPADVEGWLGSWQDPIFGANGGLVFNWYYSNNGVRIAVTGGHLVRPYSLPGVNENSDDLHGLGNEFGAQTVKGEGSTQWWHDVGKIGPDCSGTSCQIVGTDHGTQWGSDGSCWGSYAIYVSQYATEFKCQGKKLHQSIMIDKN